MELKIMKSSFNKEDVLNLKTPEKKIKYSLSYADLSGADLSHANLSGVYPIGVNLPKIIKEANDDKRS